MPRRYAATTSVPVEKALSIPDKLRFAATLLDTTNDVRTAAAIAQRALDELNRVKVLGGVGADERPQ